MNLKKILLSTLVVGAVTVAMSVSAKAYVVDENTVKPSGDYINANNFGPYDGGGVWIYPYGMVHTNGGNLNVRQGPSTNYDIIGRLSNRENITILGGQSGWDYIRYRIDGTSNHKVGWVSDDYITPTGD